MNLGALSYSGAREENARFGPLHLSIMNEELTSEEARPKAGFAGIVGQSPALREVLQLVEMVAPSDSTVLLLGRDRHGQRTHRARYSQS